MSIASSGSVRLLGLQLGRQRLGTVGMEPPNVLWRHLERVGWLRRRPEDEPQLVGLGVVEQLPDLSGVDQAKSGSVARGADGQECLSTGRDRLEPCSAVIATLCGASHSPHAPTATAHSSENQRERSKPTSAAQRMTSPPLPSIRLL
jgi:hypothetical protein